jgi:DNA repair protein RecN (Recombination protein N)
MLTHLAIRNFTIAESVDIEFHAGMTAITGETGAGKSISLDALSLALGDRAERDVVRHGAERADISASFDIGGQRRAQDWLKTRELASDDECLLRRVITSEGRSKAFINGQPVTLADLRQLGEMLIDIHSQHEHQSLLQKETHRRLLDAFAGAGNIAGTVKKAYEQWHETAQTLATLQQADHEQAAKAELLKFQRREFDELALQENELAQLEQKQDVLSKADDIIRASRLALALCEEGDGGSIESLLRQAVAALAPFANAQPILREAHEMLASAEIQVSEARHALARHIDSFDADPATLALIQDRLNTIYTLARKHRVQPEQLLALQQKIDADLAAMDNSEERLQALDAQLKQQLAAYQKAADELSALRKKGVQKLCKAVADKLKLLGMQHCSFDVALTSSSNREPARHGNESIEFVIATNPGQPPQPLAKIASGGELSRISLAIQVVTAQTSAIPTLVFDEVDVGIGGGTAEVVGRLLRELGDRGQVICVTHQPQVAARSHHHLRVSKQVKAKSTQTQVEVLSEKGKIDEVARMLGGVEITDTTRAHAKEMLALAE